MEPRRNHHRRNVSDDPDSVGGLRRYNCQRPETPGVPTLGPLRVFMSILSNEGRRLLAPR
jgi:hypothetical protein